MPCRNFSHKRCQWIGFVASSSGGTQAGLACGSRLFGFKGKILGISIDLLREKLQAHVAQLASEVSYLENNPISFTPEDILVNSDYCKAGYGVFTDLEKNAIRLFAEYEGLLLDPVYTGRAAGGLIDLINKGFLKKKIVYYSGIPDVSPHYLRLLIPGLIWSCKTLFFRNMPNFDHFCYGILQRFYSNILLYYHQVDRVLIELTQLLCIFSLTNPEGSLILIGSSRIVSRCCCSTLNILQTATFTARSLRSETFNN